MELEYLGRCVLCGKRIEPDEKVAKTVTLVPTPGPRPPHFTTSKTVIVRWCGACWEFVEEKASPSIRKVLVLGNNLASSVGL